MTTEPWHRKIERAADIDGETIECCARLSTAISLKRIADTLLDIKLQMENNRPKTLYPENWK